MAGTSTIGDVGVVSPTVHYTSISLIDASGDLFTETIESVVAPTEAQVQAWVAAYQAATQASVYKVSMSQVWEGDADPQNAETNIRYTVADGVNLLFKDVAARMSFTGRLVAPVPANMQGNQDIPLVQGSPLESAITAYLTLLGSYSLNSAQYTERRERKNNPRVKV